MKREYVPALLLVLALVALGMSAIGPNDRLTWLLEVGPVLAGAPILFLAYRRFPLSHLAYTLLFLHSVILVVGGHYTYAEVPLGFWAQDFFDLSRNPYDRLGHFAQGFVPALLAREILKRWSPLGDSRWLPFLVVCFCLSFSAFYELFEWWSALVLGQSASQFLGTQGDVWDTQWDMFLALIGATLSLIMLSKAHDKSLAKVIMLS
jgi:putative membrane protein